MAKLRLFTLSLIPVFVFGQQNATAASNVTTDAPTTTPAEITPTKTPSTTQSPTSLSDDSVVDELPNLMAHIPPWGESAFGGFGESSYRKAGLLDIRRDGWSWTPSYLRKSAPFCYDTSPRPLSANRRITISTCYTGDVATMCKALGGTSSYQDTICIEDPAMPFDVVGPVCWNQTCYNEATFKTCTTLGGQFVGGQVNAPITDEMNNDDYFVTHRSDAAWCAVSGRHTIVGPACYGEVCFTEELAKGCAGLGGTNFADIFCLLDDSYTVIGPICNPTANKTEDASVCFPEETAKLCLDMGGTNIGDIFCVIKGGNYSVLGPFCNQVDFYDDPNDNGTELVYAECTDGSDVCRKIGGNPLGKGTFCVVKGDDYVAVGPLCTTGGGCLILAGSFPDIDGGYTTCEYDLGGTNIGEFICLLKGAFSVIGPMVWGDSFFLGNVLADAVSESQSILHSISSWIILNGTFSVYGPTCYGRSCYDGDCLEAGGSSFGGVFCAVQEEGPGISTSAVQRTSGLFTAAITLLLCMLMSATVM